MLGALTSFGRYAGRITARGRSGILVGEQAGSEALTLANALDLDGRRFDDPLDSLDAVEQLRISRRFHHVLLAAILTEEVRAGERTGEDADAGEHSDERDDDTKVGWHGPPSTSEYGPGFLGAAISEKGRFVPSSSRGARGSPR